MSEERAKGTFNVREMTHFIDGGEHITKVKHFCSLKDERANDARL